jgi:molecular chaperone GrpE
MQDQNQTPEAAATNPAPEAAGAPSVAPATAPTSEDRIKELEAQLAAAKEDFLRAKAETENTRRRAAEDIAKAHKFAVESFAEALVPVKDSLDAAAADTTGSVDTLKNGVDLTIKQLTAAFDKGRVTIIDPSGEKFDPAKHQAISMVEADGEANRVVSVLQKGYLIYDRVLRPALVTVSKAKTEQPAA